MTVLFAQARFCAGCSADLFALGWRLYVAWLGEQRRMGDALTQNSYCVCVFVRACVSLCVCLRTPSQCWRLRICKPWVAMCFCCRRLALCAV
jgi:hypothetical protein